MRLMVALAWSDVYRDAAELVRLPMPSRSRSPSNLDIARTGITRLRPNETAP